MALIADINNLTGGGGIGEQTHQVSDVSMPLKLDPCEAPQLGAGARIWDFRRCAEDCPVE
jgi:hypothetical protein